MAAKSQRLLRFGRRRQTYLGKILGYGSAVYAVITLGLWVELQNREPRRLDTSLTPHEFHFHRVMNAKPPWKMVEDFQRNRKYRDYRHNDNPKSAEDTEKLSDGQPSTPPPFVVDVLSIGSMSRTSLLEAQVDTWGSHVAIRNFWAFSEVHDFDPDCHKMSPPKTTDHIQRCTNPSFYGWSWQYTRFLRRLYTLTDGYRKHADAGWICAQRRVGRALGWVQTVYGGPRFDIAPSRGRKGWQSAILPGNPGKMGEPNEAPPIEDAPLSLPDFLLLVDDDTYFDITAFWNHYQEEASQSSSPFVTTMDTQKQQQQQQPSAPQSQEEHPQPKVHSGCLMENTNDFVRRFIYPFSFPNGGFGTVFNQKMLAQWIEPIVCDRNEEAEDASTPMPPRTLASSSACPALEENRFGEAAVFRPGMSVLDLFYKYSAIAEFCLHSDWLLGYMLTYYSGAEEEAPTHPPSPFLSQHLRSTAFAAAAAAAAEATEQAQAEPGFSWKYLGISQEDCGNHTLMGDIIPCPFGTTTCHRLTPEQMEAASLYSYQQRPTFFKRQPLLWAYLESISKQNEGEEALL